MKFKKYPKLRRSGYAEVRGIEDGICHIFPKLDGTNASVWLGEDGKIRAGSRNRGLSLDNDNAGFYNAIKDDSRIIEYFKEFPNHRLYGEWLVPHSYKDYENEAWMKFYVFDVLDGGDSFIPYNVYVDYLSQHNIDFIPIIDIIENPSHEDLLKYVEKATFLTKDNKVGEGIVIKNYKFINAFGDTTWAKIISDTFVNKGNKNKTENKPVGCVEYQIIQKFCTEDLIEKEYSKILNSNNGEWSGRDIPRLLGIVWHEFLTEELPQAIKRFKNPIVDFKRLQSELNNKVKATKRELF